MKSRFFSLLRRAPALLFLSPFAAMAAGDGAGTNDSPAAAPPAVENRKAPLDYVRLSEDKKSTRLEVLVSTLTLPDGRKVDLFGVVHLADAAYYKEVNQRLAGYDAVLFELVGNPEVLQGKALPPPPDAPAPRPHPLRMIQEGVGNVFKLQFQLEQIDYTPPHFIHADATAEEFVKMQAERGESMMKLLLKSFQMSGDPALQEKFRAAENLGLADLVMLFYSEKTMQRIKVVFARLLADSEEIFESHLLESDNAIISGRNGVALKKLKEVLEDPAMKRTAIFYGAGHMPSMEVDLIKDWQAKRTGETWLPAWVMPPAAESKPLPKSPP